MKTKIKGSRNRIRNVPFIKIGRCRYRFSIGTRENNWISVAPDWACEILSPKSIRIDRVKKMRIYARSQVRYAWLIDPVQMTLEAFRLEAGKWVVLGVYAEDEKVRVEPFQEIEIDLTHLWLEMRIRRAGKPQA